MSSDREIAEAKWNAGEAALSRSRKVLGQVSKFIADALEEAKVKIEAECKELEHSLYMEETKGDS